MSDEQPPIPKPQFQTYALGFTIEGPDTPMGRSLVDEIDKAQREANEYLDALLSGTLPPAPPRPTVPKWKTQLARRLVQWAMELDPDEVLE
jgi:hypothetical protein